MEAASRHGVSLEGQRARQVADSDYTDADWLLAMDASNLATLTRRAPARGVRLGSSCSTVRRVAQVRTCRTLTMAAMKASSRSMR